MARIWTLAALAVAIWLLSVHGQSRPGALGTDAPPAQFSAARADAVLGRVLGDQAPHPAGSANAEAVRARILDELAAMDVHAVTKTGMSCYSEKRWNNIPCGTVTNIVAGVAPGAGKAILLLAHSDSVAAGPGAGDDGSGVAILLEVIRALKARGIEGGAAHPVIALFTDGEEAGMLGAAFYLSEPLQRAKIGAVINVEARGNKGPSYLFQTSAGNGKLIDLYAARVKQYATSSLYGEIYKFMPNDTDLTPVLATSALAYNFAFIGNAAQYHTPLDRRENIDPQSLQQQGDAALELADSLARSDLETLRGPDAIYLDVVGRWLPRLPAGWALPLSIAAFAVIALAGFLTRRERRVLSRPVLAGLAPVLLVAGALGMGFVLHGLAAWISGQPDPSFATPVWLRLSLGFGVFAVALLVSRWAAATACWLWFAAAGLACAIFAPGLTPYFLFPALVAAPLLLVTVRGGRGPALLLLALAALVVWIGLAACGEVIMGLKLHSLFTVSAAFGLLALLPLLGKAKMWGWSFILSLLLAVGLSVAAGLQPSFSPDAPQRLNLHFAEMDGKATWLADPVARLPDSLRAAANFSAQPQSFFEHGYVAPAGPSRHPAPTALVSRNGDQVMLDVKAQGDAVMLVVPAKARLQALTIGGVTIPVSERRILIDCVTPDCGHAHMTLRLGSPEAVDLFLVARRRELPADGARLLRARGADATATHGGDSTLMAAKIAIPAR